MTVYIKSIGLKEIHSCTDYQKRVFLRISGR